MLAAVLSLFKKAQRGTKDCIHRCWYRETPLCQKKDVKKCPLKDKDDSLQLSQNIRQGLQDQGRVGEAFETVGR